MKLFEGKVKRQLQRILLDLEDLAQSDVDDWQWSEITRIQREVELALEKQKICSK